MMTVQMAIKKMCGYVEHSKRCSRNRNRPTAMGTCNCGLYELRVAIADWEKKTKSQEKQVNHETNK